MNFSRLPLLAALILSVPLLSRAAPGDFRITSPDFAEGASIPSRFTCEGDNISPTLQIAGVPPGAQSLVLIVDDPDAPSGTFTHWLLWNIPPGTKEIRAGTPLAAALQGVNDFGTPGYSGPCPPSGTHRYFFRLSALDIPLRLAAGASRSDLETAMNGHILSTAILMGRYAKTGSQ